VRLKILINSVFTSYHFRAGSCSLILGNGLEKLEIAFSLRV
jgi:hypothetical protein